MTVPEDDVELVAQRCNVGMDLARRTIQYKDGDLAAAIARIEEGNLPTQEELTAKNRRGSSDIPEDDVELVAQRADAPLAKAHDVLQHKNGDLAAAISVLTQENSSSHDATTNTFNQSTGSATDDTNIYNPDKETQHTDTEIYTSGGDTGADGTCPSCGTDFTEFRDVNFCPECGFERSG